MMATISPPMHPTFPRPVTSRRVRMEDTLGWKGEVWEGVRYGKATVMGAVKGGRERGKDQDEDGTVRGEGEEGAEMGELVR